MMRRPGSPLILIFERVLDPAHPFVVDAHVAEDLSGQGALGVEPSALVEKPDPVEIQRTHAAHHLGVGLSLEPGEAPTSLEPRRDSLPGQAQAGAELPGRFRDLPGRKRSRDDVERLDVDAHGELVSVAVLDRSPPSVEGEGLLVLGLSPLQIEFAIHDGEPREPDGHGGNGDRHRQREEQQPDAEPRQSTGFFRRGGCRRRARRPRGAHRDALRFRSADGPPSASMGSRTSVWSRSG